MTITMKTWFRAVSAAFADPAPAQTVGGLSLLVFSLYTGYTIPQPSMIGALRWLTYIDVRLRGFHWLYAYNIVADSMHSP